MATTYKTGKVDVSMNGVTIPAHYLTDDGVTTTITEGTREIATMAGTFTVPSGTIDEANSSFSIVLPGMDYLKNVFPDLYEAGTEGQDKGRVGFGGNTCTARGTTPVVIHYTCDENSDDDVFIPVGAVQYNATLTQNASDPLTVEVTVHAQPSDDHDGKVAFYGTGSLTEKTLWNPATEEYESIED